MQLLSIEGYLATMLFIFTDHMSSNCRIILNNKWERCGKEGEELLPVSAGRGMKAPISGPAGPCDEMGSPLDTKQKYKHPTETFASFYWKYDTVVGMSMSICKMATTIIFFDLEMVHNFIDRNMQYNLSTSSKSIQQ
jgi:hypothetical protein